MESGQDVARKMRRYSRMKGPDVFQGREEWVHFRDWGGGPGGWGSGFHTPGTSLMDGSKAC